MAEDNSTNSSTDWSEEELKELIDSLLKKTSKTTKSYKAVETSFNWSEIASDIDGRTADECRATYLRITNKVRKYRTMPEILEDAITLVKTNKTNPKAYPDMPKKPTNAYSIFVRKKLKKITGMSSKEKMTQLGKDWSAMSEEKKEVYKKKYLKQRKKYEEAVEEFRKNHPGVKIPGAPKQQVPHPSKLFVDSRFEKEQSKHPEMTAPELHKKLLKKYEKLSDSKILKWIKKAKAQYEVYKSQQASNVKLAATLRLSKREQQILDSSMGKPTVAPPKNVFLYYCNSKRESVAHLSIAEQSKILSGLYHSLSEKELKEIKQKFQQEVEDYIEAYNHFYNSLTEEQKPGEKLPEAALADYHKLLQRNVPKTRTPSKTSKTKGSKQVEINVSGTAKSTKPEKQLKLSDMLPRLGIANHTASDSSSPADSDNNATPPSSQPEVIEIPGKSRKRKSGEGVSPKKKKPKIENSTEQDEASRTGKAEDVGSKKASKSPKKTKSPKDILTVADGSSPEKMNAEWNSPEKAEINENLLSMFSPLHPPAVGSSQEEGSSSPSKKGHKKKSKTKN